MERCSLRGAPQEPDGESREEPEEHKRKEVELRCQLPGFASGSATTMERACARCPCWTSVRHMFSDTGKTESCSIKAPVRQTGDPGQVESLTGKHNRKMKECAREKCSCWESNNNSVMAWSKNTWMALDYNSFDHRLDQGKT